MDRPHRIGLTDDEASRRLTKYGSNEVPRSETRSRLKLAFEIVSEPMFLLLVACGVFYLFLGDIEEALLLLGFVFLTMGISFYQQRKTDRAIDSLRMLSAPYATVVRHGEAHRIPSAEVVPGDIILLREGDRVCADAVVLESHDVSTDESLLTGESVPVSKSECPEAAQNGARSNECMVFSGTLIVAGEGVGEVLATGTNTELGKIGSSLLDIKTERTLLERETGRMVRLLATVGLLLCVLTTVAYSWMQHDVVSGVLVGLTLAMAVIPEELPVVFTLFLTLGAWRMSRQQVLTRRPPAIETLGSATVLCTDKTGTLTENQMTVVRLAVGVDVREVTVGGSLPAAFRDVVLYALLSSSVDPYDPMEKAINTLAGSLDLRAPEHEQWELKKVYPRTRELFAVTQLWVTGASDDTTSDVVVACKGAPEAVARLCHLDDEQLARILRQSEQMAAEGIRILGVAKSKTSLEHELLEVKPSPGKQARWPEVDAYDFQWLGLIGFRDPVREAVPRAISACQSAGVRVVMVTGDHPVTAQSIAREVGIHKLETVMTGVQLDKLSDDELKSVVREVDIYARIVPEQKLRLVNALKANGEIVAMTGDGINDAPALKSAHIGIAMGRRGTDVAREAASLVLLEDDFSAIASALKLGRRIYDNLKKAFIYTLAIHIPIIGLSVLPILLHMPPVLFPAHVVFMELIIDPACSIAFEAEPAEADVMKRRPRDANQRMFELPTVALAGLQGLSVLAMSLVAYWLGNTFNLDEGAIRAMTFVTLICGNVMLILANRSWSESILQSFHTKNPAVRWITGGALVLLIAVIYIPFLKNLFQFSSLSLASALAAMLLGGVSAVWVDFIKRGRRVG